MEFKDYYKVLGVPENADEAAIKAAYRKLAKQHHPDVNPGNQEAEERFKEVNEAYQALSNAEARQKYDQLRQQYQRYQQSGGQPQDFNWQQYAAGAGEGPQVRYATAEDFEDLFGQENPYSDFFSTLFGRGRAGSGAQRSARPRAGRDVEVEAELTLEEAYHGASRMIQVGERRIEARIPAGVRTGSRVRLAGQGEPGRGGKAGDLYLITRVLPNPQFEREGDTLYTVVPVDIYTAVLGGEVRVPALDRPVLLKIPAQTQADRSFRLRGKGMPHLSGGGRGDLFARVKLVLPDNLSEQEINAFRELASTHQRVS